MKTFLIFNSLLLGFCLLFSSPIPKTFEVNEEFHRPVVHRLVVKKINEEWRVVFPDDENQSDIIANKGDRIRWDVEGSAVTLSFPDPKLFGNATFEIKDGRNRTLPVLRTATDGTYEYEVYIQVDGVYARGQSPPRIIIR
ncbi:hypothetical protein [Pararhodonellum marinum]|uniref:hypothetical protein n=1 Tax=Pararhodonellum marinum TaxID=2755358 RepID=UPI0018907D1E|nr:hypothetical protein [Pararhodonellum marinum]